MRLLRSLTIITVLSTALAAPQRQLTLPPVPPPPPSSASKASMPSSQPPDAPVQAHDKHPQRRAIAFGSALQRAENSAAHSDNAAPHRRLHARTTPPSPRPRRRMGDAVLYAVAEVTTLILALALGLGFGLGAIGVGEMLGMWTLVVAAGGLLIGIGVGAATLLILHEVNLHMLPESERGLQQGQKKQQQRLVAKIGQIAAAHGFKLRVLRAEGLGAKEADRVMARLRATFRPVNLQDQLLLA